MGIHNKCIKYWTKREKILSKIESRAAFKRRNFLAATATQVNEAKSMLTNHSFTLCIELTKDIHIDVKDKNPIRGRSLEILYTIPLLNNKLTGYYG